MKKAQWLCALLLIFPALTYSAKPAPLSAIEKSTGRLLINVDSSAGFSAEELAESISAKLILLDKRNPYKDFPPNFFDYPLVVISPPMEPHVLRALANRFGYRYASLSGEHLLDETKHVEYLLQQAPKYTSDIPRCSEEEMNRLYDLMAKVDKVFKDNQITYWATGGTLIGAVRYRGIMPWDDDLDICILDADEKKLGTIKDDLDAQGLGIYKKDIYKIYFKDGTPIENVNECGTFLPYASPGLDVFVMTLEKGKEAEDRYIHQAPYFFWKFGTTDGFYYSQIENIEHVPFGSMEIPVARNAEKFLNDNYGTPYYPELWKYYSKEASWSHQLEAPTATPGTSFVLVDEETPPPLTQN